MPALETYYVSALGPADLGSFALFSQGWAELACAGCGPVFKLLMSLFNINFYIDTASKACKKTISL
jgi:hypothetical protein